MFGHWDVCRDKGDLWLEAFEEESSSDQEVSWHEWGRETKEVAPSKRNAKMFASDESTARSKRTEKRFQVATVSEALASL